MPRGGFRHKRIFTPEELTLIADDNLSITKLCKLVNASAPTIGKVRKELDVNTIRGRRYGEGIKNKTVICANPACQKEFMIKPAVRKRFCSKSCSTTIVNPAPKGKGSRPYQVKEHTPEFTKYKRLVHSLSQETYNNNIDIINPNRYPRTICGVDSGWQLDHIKTILECYNQGISPQEASSIENLRMLPWQDNLMRNFKEN